MLDDEARRALEEEAIALVSLSTSQPVDADAASPQAASRDGLLQRHKDARRDDGRAAPPAIFRPHDAKPTTDHGYLSMSVFVNADGKMSVVPSGKSSPDHHASFELAAVDLVANKDDDALKRERASSPAPSDPQISMQSLLVTLKKRKGEDACDGAPAPAIKLPRFRDVFEQSRSELVPSAGVSMQMPPAPYMAQAPPPSIPASPPPVSEQMEESPYPPPPELKCKYRTGKCGNIRALKSCGDYHNLCNYHRLRANANQRKLDRKKKVQRGQPAMGSPSEATSPVAAPALVAPPTASAAATLASMPNSFMLQRPSSVASHGSLPGGAPFLPYLVPPSVAAPPPTTGSASLLRPKPEAKSC